MPSTRDIRRRIKSVKNTAQITKAMQMVASAKMRKAQSVALAGRPYASLMTDVLAAAVAGAGEFSHPLMERREIKKRAVILVSTDKGLCGALNTNLLREAAKFDKNTTVFVTAGRKAAQWAARAKRDLAAEFSYKDIPQFAEARAISRCARDLFLEGKVDEVSILYSRFITTLTQKPEVRPLLPLAELTGFGPKGEPVELKPTAQEFLFEPNPAGVLGSLLPKYLDYVVYQILLESKASEQSARMVAMKNATDNAKQLIKDLTLEYNKLRQANITKELLEITSAAMAMG
ncbi:MAG TPA: ATP synthase F1 subunit gamma [Candidatus Limnocylindria bacterium]|jgi:F-type H+-transporting ATPase subunit gamma|nr:ATP synthase F1 subunit gamma [Candidatus Limnocylindria bacterium]